MNRFFRSLPVLALTLATFACSGTTSSAAADGGPSTTNPPTGGGGTTLSCLIQLKGFEPQCQLYEATGADASKTLDQVRASCVDSAAATAKVVEVCPTDNGLGGCKTPVAVKDGADVKLFITSFEYVPTGDAGIGTHSTAAEVKSFCANQGKDATYVAP